MTESLNILLKQTSRSFYLTLRVLPAAVRPQIGLAYLLARTTDTIADTEWIPLAQRLSALQALRERVLGPSAAPLNFGELARSQAAPSERALLENVEAALAALRALSPADRQLTRTVLDTITSGQELDLERFSERGQTPGESARGDNRPTGQNIIALQNPAELDDYTYRVAGCVGEFWTKMCRTHLFPKAKLDDGQLLADGIRFGKGLQLVNILRDLPGDLRAGRCYIPQSELDGAGLKPGDLLSVAHEGRFRPVYDKHLSLAEKHLAAGWAYTTSLPRNQFRVRLACAWPILIGTRTLQKLRSENILNPSRRVKISRAELRHLMAKSILLYPFPEKWDAQFP